MANFGTDDTPLNFGESNIECSYIQNLLYNFYTPTIQVIKDFKELEDFKYEGLSCIKDGSIYTYLQNDYKFQDTYIPGKNYLGITRNHLSESNNYNTNLHEALGDYLRFIRDYYDLDLMPLYNCFSNRFIDTFSLPIEEKGRTNPIKEGYKVFAFPVKYNKNYIIRCKGNISANLQLAFYNGKSPLNVKFQGQTQQISVVFPLQCLSIPGEAFKVLNAVDYVPELAEEDRLIYEQLLKDNEINLYLFVELPNYNASDIVIIEEVENSSNLVLNNYLLEKKLQIPFSPKLIGYLMDYYITPISEIEENIAKVQEILSSKDFYVKDIQGKVVQANSMRLGEGTYKEYTKGVFDYTTRNFIYNLFRFAGIVDFTGYIDKDVEDLILKESK